MEVLEAVADESGARRDNAAEEGDYDGLPFSFQGEDQDAFAALLELADQEDAQDSCASQNKANERPPAIEAQPKAAPLEPEGPDRPSNGQPSVELKIKSSGKDWPDSISQRSQKKQRRFEDSQENDSNATNRGRQAARPVQAQKRKVAAFTSALTRDQDGQVNTHEADQGALRKATMAPTREKYSGLRMKNPVFPSVVLQERMSMLHFLRLSRAGDRAEAGEAAGLWATIAVLTEKSRPRQSSSGQAFSMWKVSDLAGATVTVFLFGDAHTSLFRESEGSIVAICNARATVGGPGKGVSLKVADPSFIYKLGTSADFALCGARTKNGETCRNAVNVSVCRFCDYHVQGEFKRLNSSRGPLITATVGARLGAHAKAAAKRQVQPVGLRYVPPVPDLQELESAAASCNSQGARHIASVFRKDTAGRPSTTNTANPSQIGRQKEAAKAEPRAYANSAAEQKAKGLFAVPDSRAGRQPSLSQPAPSTRPCSASAQPAMMSLAGRQPHRSASEQPVSTMQSGLSSCPGSAHAGQEGGKQAVAPQQGSGSHPSEARKEALVMLEDAEIDWDVADIQKVQQRARDTTRRDSEEEDARGMPAVPRPISPVRMPAPIVTHASALAQQTGQAQQADAVLRAIQIVQSRGGVEAMAAEQKAARKRDNTALAAARSSAAAATSLAKPDVITGQEAHQQGSGSIAAAKTALEPKAFFSAQPSRPSGASTQPSSAGSRERLAAKLGLAPKSALGRKPPVAGKTSAVVCQPGQSAFAAAFGDALKDVDMRQTGTRYKAVIEDEEHERLDALLGTLQRKDEAQQRMEAITHLTVTAWRCAVCASTTNKRSASCQGHEGTSVTVTKRWWTCAGCRHRFSTLGVKYPTKRCPNARCCAPESEFIKAGMAPSKARSKDMPGEPALASREGFQARGTEHSFSLK